MSDSQSSSPSRPSNAWLLISVLFSSVPLTEALALKLQKTAFDLYAADETVKRVSGPALQGEVRNLHKTLVLGGLSGPAFEARLDTERGEGVVRYLLTQDGLAHLARARPRHLLN